MAEQTSIFAGTGTVQTHGAVAWAADNAAWAMPSRARVAERSPALLRQVNELMREWRLGQTEPEQIPFFCECRRPDCYEPVWLTGNAYDERSAEPHGPLILPGHEHATEELEWQQATG